MIVYVFEMPPVTLTQKPDMASVEIAKRELHRLADTLVPENFHPVDIGQLDSKTGEDG
jgi:hypothetical protein